LSLIWATPERKDKQLDDPRFRSPREENTPAEPVLGVDLPVRASKGYRLLSRDHGPAHITPRCGDGSIQQGSA
jgi:hypothetical protein